MLESLLLPQSIAVIGVSADPAKVGHQVFMNLQQFKGKVYPIHPKHKKLLGHSVYPDILSVPHTIDLAVITTPQVTVEDIVYQCIDKKVKAIIIISAGFAETSKSGKRIQDRIAAHCSQHQIALLGPNTLGAICPPMHLNASFASTHIPAGDIAIISQSGAMLTTIFSQLSSRKIGCSFALSLGNSAGINVIDALDYAATDPHTKIVAVYLESLPSPTLFFAKCKELSKHKPILLLKGGTTTEGQKASLSHTAALATDGRLLFEGQFQFGYTCLDTLEQFFETTFFMHYLLSQTESPPKENPFPKNLLILTNAGGPAVNAVDIASRSGIILASWSKSSISAFSREIPRVRPNNPTDLLGDASVSDISKALEIANDDPLIESILLIITRQAVTDIPAITQNLLSIYSSPKASNKKPLIVALMGGEEQRRYIHKLREAGITTVEYANEGVEVFACVNHARRSQLIDRSAQLMEELKASLKTSDIPEPTRKNFPLRSVSLAHVYLLLETYGFVLPHAAIVKNSEQLNELDALDPERVYPLIAKTANLKLKHKAVLGAVIGNIQSKQDALAAYQKLSKFGSDVLYQEVITDAAEIILGYRNDPTFGRFVAVGMGGSLANILADRSYIFLPASSREVRASLKRTKLYGQLTSEQRSLVLLSIERCIQLALDHPEICELEINPLMVTSHSAFVADIKVELSPDTI